MEEHTTLIADRIAGSLRGTSLTWSRREQYRTELQWARVKRRRMCLLPGNKSGLLDMSNMDPNFASFPEMENSEWFRKMSFMRRRCVADGAVLQLDIHGCRGPPHQPAHLNVGLGAMSQQIATTGEDNPPTLNRFAY